MWARACFFPSVLHLIGFGELAVRATMWTGCTCAVGAFVTLRSNWFAAAWCCFASLSAVDGLMLWLPWDSMLLEAGLLCALNPRAHPAARHGLTLLAAKVLICFGKHKFLGSSPGDALTYLRSHLVGQPSPTLFAWELHRPLDSVPALCACGYLLLFCGELIAPFLLFPRATRRPAAILILALMLCIQTSGNYAWFPVLTAACVLPCAASATPCNEQPLPAATTSRHLAISNGAALPPQRSLLDHLWRLVRQRGPQHSVQSGLVAAWALLSLPMMIPSQWQARPAEANPHPRLDETAVSRALYAHFRLSSLLQVPCLRAASAIDCPP